MTGAQLKRLGPRGLLSLCSDAATAEALQLALHGERQRDALAAAAHRSRNARMTALGNHKARGWWFCSCGFLFVLTGISSKIFREFFLLDFENDHLQRC